jgi:uncharacterized membrane protein
MPHEALALGLGLAAALCANIGMAVQKQGTPGLLMWRAFLTSSEVRRDLLVWGTGTFIRVLGIVLVIPALQWGHAAIIASFSGIGLASLILYSALVMREPVTRTELLGACLIAAGTALAGYCSAGCGQENASGGIGTLAIVSLAILAGIVGGLGYVGFRRPGLIALVAGAAAGSLDGLGILYLKFTSAHAVSHGASGVASDLAAWGWLATAVGSFLTLQYAYVFGRAVTIVPVFTCVSIAVPVCAAPWIFGESVSPGMLLGLCLLFEGIAILTASAGAMLEAELACPLPQGPPPTPSSSAGRGLSDGGLAVA